MDDEQDLCEILQYNLETEGYEVSTANSAEEALQMPLETFDLILLDVMMGDMSGFQMALKMKENPRRPCSNCWEQASPARCRTYSPRQGSGASG